MFIKKVTNRKQGSMYLTYRLVKSVRLNGKPQHVNILELGSLQELPIESHKALADRIEQLINQDSLLFENPDQLVEDFAQFFYKKLVKNLFKKQTNNAKNDDKQEDNNTETVQEISGKPVENIQEVDLDTFESINSQEIGGEWLCTQAIKELGLDDFLKKHLDWNSNEVAVGMLSLLGRLLFPASELKTADWLNENSGAFEMFSPESGTLDRNRLMQCTKKLYQNKEEIEKYLSDKIASIYNIENKLILYDLTNTHFEGQMKKCPKAKFGKNKQKRYDCRQITVGLLTDQEGFCKQSRFYAGNISEPSTFKEILGLVDAYKHQNTRPLIVMDAGIATEDNLKMSLSNGVDYLCVSRSSHSEILEKVEKDKLVCFKNESKDEVKTQFFYQPINYKIGEETHTAQETLLYVETIGKQAKESGIFGKKQQGFETGLAKIKESVQKPQKNLKNKSLAKIHERIGRLKEKFAGIGQAYNIEVMDNNGTVTDIQWQYNENNSITPKLGSYFIRTSISADKEELLWKTYRTLGEIESTFRTLKSDLDLRPVFHQKEFNIEAHLNLAVLSYFIVSFIRYRLKINKLNHCWKEIVRIMNTQKCNLNSIINTKGKKILLKTCTRPSLKANEIYTAMKYNTVPFYRKKILLDFD
jgi:transposase